MLPLLKYALRATLFLTTLSGSICGAITSATPRPEALPLSNIDGETSAIVAGCVHVITGDYFDGCNDLTVFCCEPAGVERYYTSADTSSNTLLNSWRHNHSSKLDISVSGNREEQKIMCDHFSLTGASTFYSVHSRDNESTLSFHVHANRIGLSNHFGNYLSGQTNLKNSRFIVDRGRNGKFKSIRMFTGSGECHHFGSDDNDEYHQYLKHIQKSNGNLVKYTYTNDSRVKEAITTNASGAVLNWIRFIYPSPNDFKRDKLMAVMCSDGRQANYRFCTYSNSYHDRKNGYPDRHYIIEAQVPGQPLETYQYGGRVRPYSEILVKKSRPEGRFLGIEYYVQNKNMVGDTEFVVKDPLIHDRVKLLKAPVGTDNTPIITHRFFYEFHNKSDRTMGRTYKDGTTTVYDALNHKVTYKYSCGHRLTEINRFTGTSSYQIYSKEKLWWAQDNAVSPTVFSHETLNLLSKVIEDGSDHAICANSYHYDKRGNVLKEMLWGNITGKSQIPLIIKDGRPQDNGCEHYEKEFAYSGDDYNLLIEEKESNGKRVLFSYLPNTNLMVSRLTCEGEQIRIREFFEYDANAVIVKKTIDDGSSSNKNDLANVTEKRITEIVPKAANPGIGLPEVVIEKYLNISTGAEVLLGKTVNHYDAYAYLIRQDTYDCNNTLVSLLTRQYNEMGKVISETNALGHNVKRTYDANGNMLTEEGPRPGFLKMYTYDYSNRLIRQEEIDSNGMHLTIAHTYNHLSQKIETTDVFGNVTRFIYDDLGRLIQTINVAVMDENESQISPTTSLQYDVLGNVTALTDARGSTTKTKYNIRGQPIEIRYADGTRESREYNLNGTLRKSVAINGLETRFTYDFLSRPIKQEMYSEDQKLLSSVSSTYSALHLISTLDAEGHITKYSYDGAGRTISVCKGDSQIDTIYDPLSRVAKTKTWYGIGAEEISLKVFKYNLLNRLVEESTEDNLGNILHQTGYAYDEDGNRTQITSYTELGKSLTTIEYDPYKKPIKNADALGNTTWTDYDYTYRNTQNQRVLKITMTDPLGNVTETIHDALGRIVTLLRKSAFGNIRSKRDMSYDANGNRVRVVETVITPGESDREVTHAFNYDSSNRLVKITEAEGSHQQKITSYAYNIYGQKERATKPDGNHIFYEYDDLGRLAVLKSSDGSIAYEYEYDKNDHAIKSTNLLIGTSTSRYYDENDRLASEILENNVTIGYAYDRKGRPLQLKFPDGSGVSYLYDAAFLRGISRIGEDGKTRYTHSYKHYNKMGLLTEVELGSDSGKTSYKYDILGRVTSIIAENDNGILWSESIPGGDLTGYDSVGNLINYDIKDNAGDISCHFEYDDLYQLISEKGISPHTYCCDSLYNRIAKDEKPYEINALNQLLQENDRRYTYDANGNMIGRHSASGSVFYEYDALDRLINVMDQSRNQKIFYSYDSFNRRLSKTISSLATSGNSDSIQSKILYMYQGQDEVGSIDVNKDPHKIAELRILGVGKGAEIGASVAIELQSKVFIPIHDHNGNINCLIDTESPQVVESYRYSAFGEEQVFNVNGERIEKSEVENPWHFSSKRLDPETGFVYFGRRYYDPIIGKWITPDPIGFDGGPNLYAYVMNSPLTHFDLYGLAGVSWARSGDNWIPVKAGQTVKNSWLQSSGARSPGMNPVTSIGNGLYNAGQQVLPPIPLAKTLVKSVGRFLSTGELSWPSDAHDEHSSYTSFMGKEIPDGAGAIVFINGVMTTKSEFDQASGINQKHVAGYELTALHNSTHGMTTDLSEFAAQLVGIPTNSVREFVKCINAQFDKLSPHGRIAVFAHSQGGAIVDAAKKYLTVDQMKRMDIYTFGSAKIIENGTFGSAKNYVSWRDPIPFLADPIGCIKGMFSKNSNVEFLNSNGTRFMDHGIGNPTYQAAMNVAGNEAVRRFERISLCR